MTEAALLLGVLLLFQQVYYMRQVQKLVDKCMSRSFHEYRVAETIKPRDTRVKEPPESDNIQDTQAIISAMF